MRAKGADLLVNEALNVGVLYLDADMPLKFFVSVVRWEIHRATQLSLEGLVVVVPEVTGFPPPDFISRKEMVTEWAQAARGNDRTDGSGCVLSAHTTGDRR